MRHLLLTLVTLLSLSLSARTLSPAEALERVKRADKQINSTTATYPKLVKTGYTAKQQPAYYIFNNTGQDADGYMILSADDVAMPVLGYSNSGRISGDSLPENMTAWLQGYADEIAWATEKANRDGYVVGDAMQTKAVAKARASMSPIAPLCTTKWNQGAPFNNTTPTISYNGNQVHCVTGCVATAMAQVMKYFNYPTVGSGVPSYTWTRPDTGVEETLTMNLADAVFDWDNMLDVYTSGNYTAGQANAVATLMKACGYSVSMNYGLASGAHTANVVTALRNYFGYDAAMKIYNRQYYDLGTWETMLYNNLRDVGPIEYSGYNDEAGHAFVVDGYSYDGFFHLNWGWGGTSDGYFLITALDPSEQGIGGSMAGYNISQSAILGARPSTGIAYEPEGFRLGISYMDDAEVANSILTVKGFFANIGGDANGIYAGLQYCDSNDNELQIMLYGNFGSWGSGLGLSQIASYLPDNLADGTYKVYPVASVDNGVTYQRAVAPIGTKNYVILTKDGDNYSVTLAESNAVTIDFGFDSPIYGGRPFAMSGTVANDNDTETLQTARLAFLNSDYEIEALGATLAIDLNGGEMLDLPTSGSILEGSLTVGNTYYAVYYDTNTGQILSNTEVVTVENDPGEATLQKTTNFSLVDADNVDPENICINYNIYCQSGFYSDRLYTLIYNEELTGSYVEYLYTSKSHILSAGNWNEMTNVRIGRSDVLEPGKRYAAVLYYVKGGYLNQVSYPAYFTVKQTTVIDEIDADVESLTPAEVYNLQGVRVESDGENLPAGIYIVRRGDNVKKILVK